MIPGSAYPKMSIGREGEQSSTRITRKWLGDISFDELQFTYDMSYDANPLGQVCLGRVHDGRVEVAIAGGAEDVFSPGDVALVSPPELPYSGRVFAATYDVTMFDPTCSPRRVTGLGPLRRARSATRPPAAVEQGGPSTRRRDRLRACRGAREDTETSPLVAASTASFLASMVIATLPTNAALNPDAADRAAVHVTARTLQYTFRRCLDTSPMEYLRRFSALYRRTYGRAPSTTLRG
ncbi:AraC family transcriptional regulator [Mycobacterium sp. B14F4]|uniref:AraC family transcriptional regulator n=1 Tax=Mycobacterium sp. B14F4 TaxID=3153565 RepID=UPI00325E4F4F